MSKPLTPSTLVATHAVIVALAAGGDELPRRIVLFPAAGVQKMRDGRVFRFDFAKLVARFVSDGIKVPIDVNHATEVLAPKGERADPVGWVVALEVDGAALCGVVEWCPETTPALLEKYPYVSPAFPAPKGEAEWLKSVALVSSPALGNQPALAAASDTETEDPLMKTVITALGLAEGATEAECLAAVTKLQGAAKDVVPKSVHDETVAKLAATASELDGIKLAGRKAKVDAVIEGALTAKKIVPAQRDHYTSLCATDEGLAVVEALLAAAPVLLAGSGLDDKPAPGGGDVVTLSAEDRVVMDQLGLTEAAYREANGMPKA